MTATLKRHWDSWGAKTVFCAVCVAAISGLRLYSNSLNDDRYWKIEDQRKFDASLRSEITDIKTELKEQRDETREDLKEIQGDIKTLLRRRE